MSWCTAAGGNGFVQDLDKPSTNPVRSVSPSKAGTALGAPDPAPLDPDKAQFGSAVDPNDVLSLLGHIVKLRCRCGGFRSLRPVTVIDHCLPIV
jgi:hypothetical protein